MQTERHEPARGGKDASSPEFPRRPREREGSRDSLPPNSAPVALRDRNECLRGEQRALAVFASAALAAIAWISSPVAVGILLGTLLGFTIQPLYERLVARYQRPRLIAAGCVAVSAVGLLGVLSG